MPELIGIQDASDPRVDAYRNQRDAWLRARHNPEAERNAGTNAASPETEETGLFMAEGKLVLRQLVQSRFVPASLLVLEHRLEVIADELAELPESTPVYVVDRPTMAAICGFDVHRGILCAAQRGVPLSVADVLGRCQTLVVLEDLSNHDNVGGIFRSVAALAGPERAGILLSPGCCDPLYRKAIRVSMGWALRVPFASVQAWPEGLDVLAEHGWTTLALTPRAGSVPIDELPTIEKPALLIGAEGPGLSEAALERVSVQTRIRIDPTVDSLNAMVAASIALHRLA